MARVQTKSETLARFAAMAPVIPVVTIDDLETAVPLARTLVEAGLPVIEVTLRTSRALAAIEAIARGVPDAVLGAGTVIRPDQIGSAIEAGSRFIVTPGTSFTMVDALCEAPVPAMPACATVSEALDLAEVGFLIVKLFPAEPSGGTRWLKAVHAPVPHIRFCPTGGITAASAPEYLACPNVACVGGSWMVPAGAVAARDWTTIGGLARAAAALRPPVPATASGLEPKGQSV